MRTAHTANGRGIRGATPSPLTSLSLVVVAAVTVLALITLPFGGNADAPHWIRWDTLLQTRDLNGDGQQEGLFLNKGMLDIQDGASAARYRAPRTWRISDALVGDIDRDGTDELVLIAWRRGSYGPSHPFWLKLDSSGLSQHIFVFRYDNGQLEPQWMSSALGFEVHHAELDDEGVLHVRAKQGEEQNELALAWDSWGFVVLE